MAEITALPIFLGVKNFFNTDEPSKTDSGAPVKKTDINNETTKNTESKSELPFDNDATKEKIKDQASPMNKDEKVTPPPHK